MDAVSTLRVGLTGGIASGKSAVAGLLAARGAVVIDDDVLAREVVAPHTPGLAQVIERFGASVESQDGALDRGALSRVVFGDDSARADLESIVHPLVERREWQLDAAAPDGSIVVHMVPLLVEVGWQAHYDQIMVVDVPESVQLTRLMARDACSPEQARARVAAQATRAERLAAADVVIDNSGSSAMTVAQVDAWWAGLKACARTPVFEAESGILIVVRHGESEYNESGTWTGVTDVDLTPKGRADARAMGRLLADVALDAAYASCMRRAWLSRDDLLAAHGGHPPVCRKTAALNERDYGDYTGLNKWQIRDRVGEHAFHDIRRAYDAVIPNGESLRDVFERVVPWYREVVVPILLSGENVLIVGHGNSDRVLRKFVEGISDEAIADVEMDFDKAYLYRVGADGRALGAPEVRRLPG
jgi:dephospho-CoA kinase